LDAPKGGPARTFDWGLATVAQQPDCCRGRPVVLAGGLTAASVAEAITRTRPAGVDVSSGIEAVVRQKDLQEMARFIQQARQAAPRAGRERTTRESRLARIIEAGVVAIVRLSDGGALPQVLSALHAGGVTALEVTFPTPNALEIIADRRERFGGEVGMGVGTVRRPAEAGRAIAAGAEFIVAPHYSPEVLGVCHAHGVPYLPGAATPTEIAAAWDAGADLIKVFPAHTLGGVEYIQALKGPYPEISLCPTGGIDEHNAAEFIQAGSLAFGVGGLLVNDRVVAERKFGEITRRSAQLMAAVQAARR
jgi:2-dehydro-3-deoxyphosphogluconate aldolase/(4S)-4-hydroxy-2-oxoglutarate aldolase